MLPHTGVWQSPLLGSPDGHRPSHEHPSQAHQAGRLRGRSAWRAVALLTLGLSRLKPAAPSVERATVWIDTVKRGPMLRQVRGLGTLVPEDIRWIPATTMGRVERIVLRPGIVVEPGTIMLELSNPALEQELEEATLKLKASEAALASLRVQLANEALAQEATTASIEADYQKAALQAKVNQQLAEKALVSTMIVQQSSLDAQQLSARLVDRQEAARQRRRRDPVPAGGAAVRGRSVARDHAAQAAPGRRAARPGRRRAACCRSSRSKSGSRSRPAPTWPAWPTPRASKPSSRSPKRRPRTCRSASPRPSTPATASSKARSAASIRRSRTAR